MQLVGNVEALQQNGGIALGGVSVFFADDAFEFAQLHAVFIGHVVLGVDGVAFLDGGPEALVAHDDGVEDRVGVEGELVLAEHAEFTRADDIAFLRLEFAAEQVHERGFAGAIGAGQAVPLARRKRRRDFVEQYFGAVAHRHIAD